jgi:hypothetical protein
MNEASVAEPISYAGYRFPPEVISYAVLLYHRSTVTKPINGRAGVLYPVGLKSSTQLGAHVMSF